MKRGASKTKSKGDRSKPKGFAGALRDLQLQTFQYAGDVRPGKQTPQRVVTEVDIAKPDYHKTGMPKSTSKMLPWVIEVKTPQEIEKMRAAGKVAREVLDIAGKMVKPGVTTDEIDAVVHEETLKRRAYPSPLNYHGFPKSCCTSVNEVICHGIPDDRKLQEGDIINIDITCYLDGYHGDCSEMFCVGTPTPEAKKLLQVTYDCWVMAMEHVKPGRHYKEIGGIIEEHVFKHGFTTVRNFCGHGIGSIFHTNPNILHFKNEEPNGQMAPGHTFTIEPMICEGSGTLRCSSKKSFPLPMVISKPSLSAFLCKAKPLMWPDQWTATTYDGKRSAQFEHTLLITEDGVEALTGKTESSPLQFWEQESEVFKGKWLGNTKDAVEKSAEISKVEESSS